MDKSKRNTIISLAVVGLISVGVLVGFSIPLGIFPPLGELLFPGNGLWNIDEEVPKMEIITSSYLTEEVTVYRDQWGIPHIYGHLRSLDLPGPRFHLRKNCWDQEKPHPLLPDFFSNRLRSGSAAPCCSCRNRGRPL